MQINYYVLGQRIQKIRKNKRISQAVLSTMIDSPLDTSAISSAVQRL